MNTENKKSNSIVENPTHNALYSFFHLNIIFERRIMLSMLWLLKDISKKVCVLNNPVYCMHHRCILNKLKSIFFDHMHRFLLFLNRKKKKTHSSFHNYCCWWKQNLFEVNIVNTPLHIDAFLLPMNTQNICLNRCHWSSTPDDVCFLRRWKSFIRYVSHYSC